MRHTLILGLLVFVVGTARGQVTATHIQSERYSLAHHFQVTTEAQIGAGFYLGEDHILVSMDDGTIAVWNVASCTEARRVRVRESGVPVVDVASEGLFVACGVDGGQVRLLAGVELVEVDSFEVDGPVEAVAVSEDGELVAWAWGTTEVGLLRRSGDRVRLSSAYDEVSPPGALRDDGDAFSIVRDLELSAEHELVCAMTQGSGIRTWDAAGGTEVGGAPAYIGQSWDPVIDPDGSRMYVGDDFGVLARASRGGRMATRAQATPGPFRTLAVSVRGSRLAGIAGDGTLRMWSLPDFEAREPIVLVDPGEATDLDWHPTEDRLLVVTSFGCAMVLARH